MLRIGLLTTIWRRVGAQDRLLKRFEPTVLEDIRGAGIVALDVKTEVNRWSFDHLKQHTACELVDPAPILEAVGLNRDVCAQTSTTRKVE